jgi:hypothetical protein
LARVGFSQPGDPRCLDSPGCARSLGIRLRVRDQDISNQAPSIIAHIFDDVRSMAQDMASNRARRVALFTLSPMCWHDICNEVISGEHRKDAIPPLVWVSAAARILVTLVVVAAR